MVIGLPGKAQSLKHWQKFWQAGLLSEGHPSLSQVVHGQARRPACTATVS